MSNQIELHDKRAFSDASFKFMVFLFLVFISTLLSMSYSGFVIPLLSGLALLVLIGRKKITLVDLDSRAINQVLSIWGVRFGQVFETIDPEAFEQVHISFIKESSVRQGFLPFAPARFDVDEVYLDLKSKDAEHHFRLKSFYDYEEANRIAVQISIAWDLDLIDQVEIRRKKVEKLRAERKRRGIR